MPYPYKADNWAWINRFIGDGYLSFPRHPGGWQLAASWVPQEDRRRLSAYTICAAFLDGTAHYWQPYMNIGQQRKWREYGDAQLFATQARSSVLGEDQTLDVQVDLDDDGQPDAAGETAREWLLGWADDESLTTRLLDAEYDAMGLGDAVYTLGFDKGGRPRCRVYDPGWFFPDPGSMGVDDDFPRTVHLAWEEPDPANPARMLLRRRTWKLMKLADVYPDATTVTYPWSEQPSDETVLYWDGTWDLSAVAGNNGLYDLSDERAVWADVDGEPARGLDLGMDFIPVVHIPNGSPGKALWGRPVWWPVVRLLDDIAASDTDAQIGSELYGSGALLDKGVGIPNGGPGAAGPGTHWTGTTDSDAKFVDMSAGMKAMVDYVASLRDLASTNARLPAEVLGRVKASEVPSGLALRLAFGPLASLVRELRQVRADKYTLLLKMVLRLAQRADLLPAGPMPRAELKFGSFLPSDQAEAVSNVTELWDRPNPAISLETAITMLINAGFPIEDAHEELLRINRESYGRAIQLLEATGSEVAVRALLNEGDQGKVPDAPVVSVLPPPNPAHKITEPDAAPPGSGNQPPQPPPGGGQ
jgi:hypothetical protein